MKGTRYSLRIEPEKQITFAVETGVVKIEYPGKLIVNEGRIEKEVPRVDFLKARERKSYRLDIDEYLARFKHFGDAEEYCRRQLAADRQSGDPQRIESGVNVMGIALMTLSKSQAAIAYFAELLDSSRQRHPDGVHVNIATGLDNLGNGDPGGTDNLQRAIDHHQDSLHIRHRLYPDGKHPAIASSLGRLAFIRLFVGQYTDALREARETLSINPGALWIHGNAAHALLFSGHEAEALAIYRRCGNEKATPGGPSVPRPWKTLPPCVRPASATRRWPRSKRSTSRRLPTADADRS